MTWKNDLNKGLDRAAKIKPGARRSITIASILAEGLRTMGEEVVLVGGAAVEFYSQGGYSTQDIDLVVDLGPELTDFMSELGFQKMGKDFVDLQRKIYVEFPSRQLRSGEKTCKVQLEKYWIHVISLEDLIVDRLCSFKFWKSGIDGLNAMILLEMDVLDEKHLKQRASREEVEDALLLVRSLKEEVIRKKIPAVDASFFLEKKMQELGVKKKG